MSDSTRDAIAALEEYLKRYPSGHFSELAQAQLDALLAGRGERRIEVISAEANPFTKGTARANQDYRPGDLFEYQVTDMLTKVVERTQMQRVVRVLPDRVMYNGGRLITDRLGNFLKMPNGATNGPNQFYATEYAVGRKWTTRYSTVLPNGQADEFEIDFKVAVREAVVVPAGRFDAYRVTSGNRLIYGFGPSAFDMTPALQQAGASTDRPHLIAVAERLKKGKAMTYTSGCPKNQKMCCHNMAPPLAGSKCLVTA